jgi:hypothetical protein
MIGSHNVRDLLVFGQHLLGSILTALLCGASDMSLIMYETC